MPGPTAPASGGPRPAGPGRLIADRYEVADLLGRGGMAEVYAGTDRRLARPVAIKLLSPAMAARPDLRTRFEAEARAAASLSHPNAVAVFDTGEHDGVPFIVMERLPGETLADRLGAGRADPAWVRGLAEEVLAALGAAHAVGLVHRDVKPANILLASDGRAKVADFGIAKSLEAGGADLTTTGQLLGTPAYLAPERIEGAPATPASDLWSLGVVLYEALAGAKPFSGDTPLATARAVAGGSHPPLSALRPDLDPGLVAAVERAMAQDPADRFTSADEMAAALGGRAATAPTVAVAPPDATLALGDAELAAADLGAGADGAGAGWPGGDRAAGSAVVTGRRSPGRRPDGLRRGLVWAVGAALVVLVLILLARAGSGGHPAPTAGAPATPAGQAPTSASTGATDGPAAALASRLRDEADHLGPADGPLASQLASRLRSVADQVQAGGGGSDATAVLATTVGWARAGQLTAGTATTVVELLAAVPGVDTSVLSALTGGTTGTGAGSGTAATTPARGKTKKGKGGSG
ncbi:MAG: protein kinase [Acidimicrobiales bacterium]